jgi:septum site-determining protein MinD
MGDLIAVLSGKGGTGKTSVCAGIATALAQQENSVLCIDCDIGLRNLDISLGLSDQPALSFLDVCSGNYPLEQAAQHPLFPNLHFLTAPVNCTAAEIEKADFQALLRQARQQFSYVFLDAPAGIERGFELCARNADRILLVTNADPASIRDATRAAERLELMGKTNTRLVVNRVNPKLYETMRLTVDDIMDEAGLPLLGIVPEDPQVTLSAAFHKPLLLRRRKGAAAACRRIAQRMEGRNVPIALK